MRVRDESRDTDGAAAPQQYLESPQTIAAWVARGGHILSVKSNPSTGRLVFAVGGLPDAEAARFLQAIANDEMTVSVKAYMSALDSVLTLINVHRGRVRR